MLQGVKDVVVGYAGGQIPDPDYHSVCSGTTGHAEVVQVTFDPELVRFNEILEVFFSLHDPTTLNRQGADVGTQYRSIILFHNENQEIEAKTIIEHLGKDNPWGKAIVTEIAPLEIFYPAEDYHQDYFQKNPHAGYCQVVIRPKVEKFLKTYDRRLKTGSKTQHG
jgi:peptide-methionine (S)-S-oxide reductase